MGRGERPNLKRGSQVEVREEGLRPWVGEVLAVKPGATAWWVEIRREDGSGWVVPADLAGEVS